MDYLIFSDSHRHPDRIREVLSRQITRPAGIFFLGDGVDDAEEAVGNIPLYAVLGNCDRNRLTGDAYPTLCSVNVEGLRVMLMHGHLFGVKSGPTAAIAHAVENGVDLLLFGHTHEPYEETLPAGSSFGTKTLSRTLRVFNPGSLGYDSCFGMLTIRGGVPMLSRGTLDGRGL